MAPLRKGWLVCICAAGLLGCGDDWQGPYPEHAWGPASGTLYEPDEEGTSSIVGDWFPCKNASCSSLDDIGMRFEADGTLSMLEAPGSALEPNESYCKGFASWKMSYRVAGSELRIRTGDQETVYDILLLDETTLRLLAQAAGKSATMELLRIKPSRLKESCEQPSGL